MSENRQETFEALLREHLKKKSVKASADCPDENIVTAYLEGVLPRRLKEDFERHAALCSRCQEELVLLLRSEGSPLAVSSQESSQAKHAKRNWLAPILGGFEWIHNLGLKPALAILITTVISGYVGYELFQQHQERKAKVAEVVQSAPDVERTIKGKETGFSLAPELGQAQQKKVPSGLENEAGTKGGAVTAAKKPVIPSKPAASPPVAFPNAPRDEDQEKTLKDNPRLDLTKSSETDKVSSFKTNSAGLAKEEPKGLLQGMAHPGSVEQKTEALNDVKQSSAPPESNVASTQSLREDQSASENDNKSKDAAASSQRARAEELPARRSKLKLERVVGSRAASVDRSSEGKKPIQIEVSGKTFELRNNVWVDLSIAEKEKKNLTFIYKNSSRYQEQIKPLSSYQSVLSRPEDCLIQQDGKIFYVKSSP
ncbi:MAG: hypothetical protein DMG05_15385 [Acidobacteria bacterium]|nr:MAG: hypothetical protein DMG05_15385 [Acidobacteriota bacterium]